MSDLIRDVQEQRRVKDIMWIARDRRIEALCHFTRVENLSGILRNGLLSRRLLHENRLPFFPIDYDRQDGYLEAVCLSVSFPNYKMFYSKRESFRHRYQVGHSQWVVLLWEASLLWEFECLFCQQNAAHDSVRSLPLEERRSPLAFEEIFRDFESVRRLDLNLPRNYPTNPQAEVLVFGRIPISYLREIHFYNLDAWTNWYNADYIAYNANIFYGDLFFRERQDYRVWQ